MDQVDTIEKLGIKLKYGVKDRDQICSYPRYINDLIFNNPQQQLVKNIDQQLITTYVSENQTCKDK